MLMSLDVMLPFFLLRCWFPPSVGLLFCRRDLVASQLFCFVLSYVQYKEFAEKLAVTHSSERIIYLK